MYKKLIIFLFIASIIECSFAQVRGKDKVSLSATEWNDLEVIDVNCQYPHVNVVSYADENAIEKLDYQRSPYRVSLNGKWQYKISSSLSEKDLAVNAKEFNTIGWPTTTIPSLHISEGKKSVVSPEINSASIIPSQRNSVTTFYRQFDVSKVWLDYMVYLQFKVRSACYVWVNEQFVGYAEDSRAVQEFEISSYLKYGKENSVIIKTLSASDASLLEMNLDGSINGIIGDVSICLKSIPHIYDYSINTTYANATQIGTLQTKVTLNNKFRRGRYYVEAEVWSPQGKQLEKMGKWVVFDKKNEVDCSLSREFLNAEPWSDVSPSLYTLVLRVRDEQMDVLETVGTRFGFRSIAISDGVLRLNGSPITLKGVIYDGLASNAIPTKQQLSQELKQMKLMNINAIRLTKFSPVEEYLYELCDELGLYVICDANIYPFSTKNKVISVDEEFSPLFEARATNMYETYKNHTAIVAWSLGSSHDNGLCMENAYKKLKQLEKNRPVLFGGAQYSENTDIIAVSNQNKEHLKQFTTKQQRRPMLLLSYGTIDGNSFGGIEPLWSEVRSHSNIQGGFISTWNKLCGQESLLPCAEEVKYVYRSFDVSLVKTTPDFAEFEIHNYSDFLLPANYKIEYILYTEYKSSIVEGEITNLPKPKQSESVSFKVPQLSLYAGEKLFVKFVVKQRKSTPAIAKNTILEQFQLELPMKSAARQAIPSYNLQPVDISLSTQNDSSEVLSLIGGDCKLQFNLTSGQVLAYSVRDRQLIDGTFNLHTWRIPTSNDKADNNASRLWQQLAPNKVKSELVAAKYKVLEDKSVAIDVMRRYTTLDGVPLFEENQTMLFLGTGDLLLSTEVTISEQVKGIARMGYQLPINKHLTQSQWFGPSTETYPDRKGYNFKGLQTQDLSHLVSTYATPQESGNRTNVSWFSVQDNKVGLFIDMLDTLFNFSVSTYSDNDVFQQSSYANSRTSSSWLTNVDYAVAGIGDALSNNGIADKYLLTSHSYKFMIHLRGYVCEENDPRDFCKIEYPKIKSSVLPLPVISSNKTRFDGPMLISISTSLNGAEIRYTLDGTTPSEKSLLFKKPFSIEGSTIVKARVFQKDGTSSFTATQVYSFDYISEASFDLKPNTPYNKNYATALYDGEQGEVNDLSQGWIGFSGNDMSVTFALSKLINLDKVQLRFAHNPDAWIMAPESVDLFVSTDGITYSDAKSAVITYNPLSEDMNMPQVVAVDVNVDSKQVKFVKIVAKNVGRLPQWHKAKGLKSWIMSDEIILKESIE